VSFGVALFVPRELVLPEAFMLNSIAKGGADRSVLDSAASEIKSYSGDNVDDFRKFAIVGDQFGKLLEKYTLVDLGEIGTSVVGKYMYKNTRNLTEVGEAIVSSIMELRDESKIDDFIGLWLYFFVGSRKVPKMDTVRFSKEKYNNVRYCMDNTVVFY